MVQRRQRRGLAVPPSPCRWMSLEPGTDAGKKAVAKAKQKKAPFYKAKAEARSSDEGHAGRPAVILKEGLGVSRPESQDFEEEEAVGAVVLKEGPGATRPAEEEAISRKAGAPKSNKKTESAEPTRLKESGERTLAIVKEEMQSDDSVCEPVVLKPCEQPRLPEQDLSQPALLLLKGKNIEKEDLRTRIHNGCVYKYFGRPAGEGKPPEKISSHPTHMGTGGTRTVYSCPWDDKLVMKFSPWDQSAEKSWLDKLGNMSIKIQGAGTIQAEIEGRNGTRSKEIWSLALATRAAPVEKWDSTRAWELAILVSTSSQVAHICDIGRSNVCQNVEHGFLQLIDAGTWISHAAHPRFPNKTRASGFWSLLAREQPEVSAIIKAALHQAGPWNYRDFIPALIRAMVERESQVQTLLTRLLGSGPLLRDPSRAVKAG